MELGFIDSEISEARLYRSSRSFGAFDGRDIADLLFLTSLSVYLLSREDQTISVANAYAKKTVQYGSYALFRSIATDLYLLAYTLLHPGNDHVTLVDAVASKKFLSSQLTARRKQDVWKGNKDYVDPNKPSAAKRIAGTAAGAVAGRYAAGKLAKMDPKKAKNIGTGIGAIAGYWASGRRRQK